MPPTTTQTAATIASTSEVSAARQLAELLSQRCNVGETHILITDQQSLADIDEGPPAKLYTPSSLGINQEFELLASLYEAEDLAFALAPLLVKKLLTEYESVIYLSPEVMPFSPFEECYKALEENEVVLVNSVPERLPHDHAKPSDTVLASYGRISPAFAALRRGPVSERFLSAWQEHFLGAKAEISVLTHRVDLGQWLDVAAPAIAGLTVLDNPGYDVGWWNLFARELSKDKEGYQVDGKPLRFMRFTGFDPDSPNALALEQNRIRLSDNKALREIYKEYANGLKEHKDPPLPVAARYETLADSVPLDGSLRGLYRQGVRSGSLTKPLISDEGTEEFYAWLNEPATVGAHAGLTRFLEHIYNSRPDLHKLFPDLAITNAENFMEWVFGYGRDEMRTPAKLVPAQPEHLKDKHVEGPYGIDDIGVNIAGYFRSECGIGEATRFLTTGLDSVGVRNMTVQGKTVLPTRQGADFSFRIPQISPFPINIICINGDGIPRFVEEEGHPFLKDRYNIALWWWEVVGGLPHDWYRSFQYLDEVWVASEHIYNAVAPFTSVPVTRIKLPMVPKISSSRNVISDFGIEPERYTFLYIYDYHSIGKRKNPEGLIKAYKEAFPSEESGTALVLKCINSEHRREPHERMLYEACERKDIHIIESFISTEERDALIASCDCYVSLHRSEGLGLTPAEAMLLEKPVIATRYGGTLEFMNDANSYLVDYKMVEVGPGSHPYPPTCSWADPNLGQAAQLMRHVFENQAEARAKGRHAAQDLRTNHSPEAAGRIMRERLELISREVLPERLAKAEKERWAKFKLQMGSPPARGFKPRLRRAIMRPLRALTFKVMRPYMETQRQKLEGLERNLYKESARSMADVRKLSAGIGTNSTQSKLADEYKAKAQPYMNAELAPRQMTHPILGQVIGYQGNGYTPDRAKVYAAFEDVFRGPKSRVKQIQRNYLPLIKGDGPVVDIGCGRGEFLELLKEKGIEAVGVDIDEGMVARCQELGLDVVHTDANNFLEGQDDGSIAAIFAAELIEHLPYDELLRFLELSSMKLRPDGTFIAETVNPYCEEAIDAFWVDPTHEHPLFPETMLVLTANSGFPSACYYYPTGGGDIEEDRSREPVYAVVGER